MREDNLIGTILRNRYSIIDSLGRGAFGKTYLANDLDLPGQPACVVKHLKPTDPRIEVVTYAKERFEKEAQTLYRLGNEHNQIPQLFAHFQENQEFYLVQEFIEGHDLTKEISPSSSKPEKFVFKLLHDILTVLAFVHQQNVIHRDIKPQNLMRRKKDGKIVLIDFGAVKEICTLQTTNGGDEVVTNPTVRTGTPGYMPWEQENHYPQLSSDIYAVGIIAFEALTGLDSRILPRKANTYELSCDLLSKYFNIHSEFARILDTMVRYDYRQRYKNAAVALQALSQLIPIYQPQTSIPDSGVDTTILIPPKSGDELPKLAAEAPLHQRIFQFIGKFWGGDGGNTVNNNSQQSNIINTDASTISNKPVILEQPEGQVSLNSALYIKRPPIENDCYEAILQPGSLIRIKAPRQLGKTSLLTRIIDHAKQNSCQTAYLNFQSADAESLSNLDKFLQWFCGSIAEELQLPDQLTEYWQGVLGSKNKSTNYFQRYLLSSINRPVVLGLDEVDQVFQYPQVATEFFALLRAWHEKSKNDDIWQKLRLVIVHSKEVYIPLNINQSPFNVGLPIDLAEFNQSQVQELVQKHQLNWTEVEITQLMTMVGGHPYLVRRSLYEIARGRITMSQLLRTAPTEEGMFSDHLRRHLLNLQEDVNLVTAMKKVIANTNPVRLEPALAFKLRSMGLVRLQGNDVIPLCDLYRSYFSERLRGK
ncbi:MULTISPECIES: AAA-like domain-containing protein [unclassified Tolypothrix]|uniref:AAA-like domain-containing protein n=1 Tax=unclassified Tolypothrix TaxID=2649714 RepID=UPI0005EAA610|nr:MULTISPECIES: AAA-like domain-containing protein [unclassified Tolypothrix]BAY88670.1 hypothetical protein NIES3275_06480 [Microchaete diplosiphon NIES-3275]EKF00475.1 putative serine/threonine kinase [Tolypothrix sp. PCC 7601]MBE9086751.1 AAA-like domain-containing protein [Tolypothrix sp. LEGE 11397]UYD29340.1 AAA-like domain-containing protein [Tolypothrix sp. PCC 7712]UYD34753.1 AAA-like domain-containing protein [Tolypothrix sp. PCC 7601]